MQQYILLLSSLLLLSPAVSATENYSKAFDICINKSNGVTADILDCTHEEFKKQDSRLNENYKQAMAALSKEQRINLRDTQRLWLNYKNANCGMFSTLTGGTIDLIFSSDCELNMTKERADTLEWLKDVGS